MITKDEKVHAQLVSEERLRLDCKDILAIVIAVYRIFLPWAIVIAGIYVLQLLVFDLLY
jgi:hypothetical protein